MFARSAAADTQQGRATQRVNEQWGSDSLRRAPGRESLAIAVCKKKYAPFLFPATGNEGTGTTTVEVQRRLGCRLHHPHRLAVVAKHGLRSGWEPFGQWSRTKAQHLARRETRKRNRAAGGENTTTPLTTEDEVSSLSSSEQQTTAVCSRVDNSRSLCWNGNCLWKHPSRFDDVEEEIRQGLWTTVATAAAAPSEGFTEPTTAAESSTPAGALTKRRPSTDSKPPPR
jgi:hypothetical protein